MRPSEGAADRVAPAGTADQAQRADSLADRHADRKQAALCSGLSQSASGKVAR